MTPLRCTQPLQPTITAVGLPTAKQVILLMATRREDVNGVLVAANGQLDRADAAQAALNQLSQRMPALTTNDERLPLTRRNIERLPRRPVC